MEEKETGVNGCQSREYSSLLHDSERNRKKNAGNDDNQNESNPLNGKGDAKTYTRSRVKHI